jgi:hypothetical protein
MEHASRQKSTASGIETMILSLGQLIQPADADEIYDFAQGTIVAQAFTREQFHDRFRQMERRGLFWRAMGKKYIVTPKGEALGRSSLPPAKRDRMRLLILNKQRYSK